ncbi:MAG TPA: hypothetical protein VNA13_05325, partial [Xanthomonadales bacterium]|nr:hypothetical protein [Xanthomonadales bacterium]
VIAFGLYKLIENMYFLGRTKLKGKAQIVKKSRLYTIPYKSNHKLAFIWYILFCSVFIFFYSQDRSFTVALKRHKFPSSVPHNKYVPLLNRDPILIPIKSSYENLSSIRIHLDYKEDAITTKNGKKNPATLVFRLYDAGTNKLISESSRNAYLIDGTPRFPFGLSPIPDSKGKEYIAELTLKNGDKNDYVLVNTTPTSIISSYNILKDKSGNNVPGLIANKIYFTFTDLNLLFALGFGAVVAIGILRSAR